MAAWPGYEAISATQSLCKFPFPFIIFVFQSCFTFPTAFPVGHHQVLLFSQMQIAHGFTLWMFRDIETVYFFCLRSLNVFYAVTECVVALQKVSNKNKSCIFVSDGGLNLLRQFQHLHYPNLSSSRKCKTLKSCPYDVLRFWCPPPTQCSLTNALVSQIGYGRTVHFELFLCTYFIFYFQQILLPCPELEHNSWNYFVNSLEFSWPFAVCINNIWFHK